MAIKFGRSYRIVIDPKDGQDPIVIGMPLTVQFWLKRTVMQSLNYLSVDIYNLGKNTRDRIFQDRYTTRERTITLEGGYDELSLMFKGTIYEANSAREGNNIITRIEARDGFYDVNTSETFQTIEKGKTLRDVLVFLAGQFPTIEIGAIGNYPEVLQRGVTLNGNTYKLLRDYAGEDVFIDNNKIFVMKNSEAVEGGVPAINVDSGLLETPRRGDGFLTVTTLFEPRITINQIVDLESKILPVYNGQYKVTGVQHQGIISEAVGGDLRSTFDLFVGSNRFEIINEGGE